MKCERDEPYLKIERWGGRKNWRVFLFFYFKVTFYPTRSKIQHGQENTGGPSISLYERFTAFSETILKKPSFRQHATT